MYNHCEPEEVYYFMQYRIRKNNIFKLLKVSSSLVLTLEWMHFDLLFHSFSRWVKISLFVVM